LVINYAKIFSDVPTTQHLLDPLANGKEVPMVRSFWNRRLGRRQFLKESAMTGVLLSLPRRQAEAALPKNPLYWVKNIPANPFTSTSRPNDHVGVNGLLELMARHNRKFYLSDTTGPLAGPKGLIAAEDVVLIKVNAQWKYRGCTNSDVIRGLIQKILDHPDGFSGEVVIFENGQGYGSLNCEVLNLEYYPDATQHANANVESHSFQYLVDTVFAGSPVSAMLLDDFRFTLVDFGDHTTNGYRLLGEPPEDVSYPCFTTPGGHRVELQEGLWTGTGHTRQNLKLINVPVLKDHMYTNLTCSLKNTYGILSMGDGILGRHPVDPRGYGRIWGKMIATVKTPVLNIVDAIWVSQGQGVPPTRQFGFPGYPPEITTRTNQLLASQDPVALDYWAAKYILYPIDSYEKHDPVYDRVDAWLTAARDSINGRGGLNDPDNCIFVGDVTKSEAYMAVHTMNLARRSVPPFVGLLLQD
jgi:uncharacterized protein (DUF362 family)